jgi:hypothetical protein
LIATSIKKIGGLGLINLGEALFALLYKWVLFALEPSDSNLKVLSRFKSVCYKTSQNIKWELDLNWAFVNQTFIFT